MPDVQVEQEIENPPAAVENKAKPQKEKGKGKAPANNATKKKRSPVKFKSPFVKIYGDAYLHHDALKELISIIPIPGSKEEQPKIMLGFRPPYADRKIFFNKPVKGEKGADIETVIRKIKTSVRAAVREDVSQESDPLTDLIEAETAEPSSSSARNAGNVQKNNKRVLGLAGSDDEQTAGEESEEEEEEQEQNEKKSKKQKAKRYDDDEESEEGDE